MEALIRFGYDVFGMDKVSAISIILFITVFKIIKTRIDRYKEQNKGLISEMIAEIEKNNQPRYHLVVEQVFQNRFGILLNYPEIKFLTKTPTPSANIVDYKIGKRYLNFNEDYTDIGFKKGYGVNKLKLVKWVYISFYFIFAMAAFYLVWLMPSLPLNVHSGVAMYFLTVVSLLFLAYLCIDESIRPQAAIDLMEKHNKAFKADSQR
ncbi:hypothetical protein C4C99_RS23510 [Vibrio parahaemolyticus]|nr:hypothetical protein [Vibrio parahaemolyticus]EGQ8282454.1 hypothetical protein [Vibrio parahaemolyticus]EGQ8720378.1 hypothetical protein [Vibrio parahaemolyticus]EGQ8813788.1 hypothetical protein [Vibrio parahaemolyticus]EGQ8835856.1 hypothetical protein [Vibrio parahaemolyticus]